VAAIKRQAEILCHISNLYHIEPQIQVAKLLVECSFADKVFFCNSGAEANEGAIKLARRYGHEKSGEDKIRADHHERVLSRKDSGDACCDGSGKISCRLRAASHGVQVRAFRRPSVP